MDWVHTLYYLFSAFFACFLTAVALAKAGCGKNSQSYQSWISPRRSEAVGKSCQRSYSFVYSRSAGGGLVYNFTSFPHETHENHENSLFTAQLSFALQVKHGSASGGRDFGEPSFSAIIRMVRPIRMLKVTPLIGLALRAALASNLTRDYLLVSFFGAEPIRRARIEAPPLHTNFSTAPTPPSTTQ